MERKQSDSLEHYTSKSELSTSKNEDNRTILNKHLDYLEKLKSENEELKNKLSQERARNEFMEHEIEIENKPLGYDFNVDSNNTGFSLVANKLHVELIEFEKQISKLIESQEPTIKGITDQVKGIVTSISSELDTEIYGSFATKLSMPWSDIDFLISSRTLKDLNADSILTQIDQKFRELPNVFSDVKFIHGASVPVVKATCTPAYGSKKLDITIQDGKHSGPKCVQLVADYLLSFECLRYLVLPFKQLIYNSQMNDPYQGGLTSYALVLMIVAFLQMKVYNKMPTEVKSPNLGVLFIEFLSYYSNLDYMATEIKPLAPEKEIITPPFSATQGDSTPNSILVVDPLNPLNNVARSTYKFHFLKVARGNLGRIYFLSPSSRLFL